MKNLLILMAIVLAGCQSPEQTALASRYSSPWIAQHVIPGTTTRQQIYEWYGMPEHMTSALPFTLESWTAGNISRARSIIIRFKGEVVETVTATDL